MTTAPAGRKPIPVTQPSMAPLKDFQPYLEDIWESRWLTNGGPYHEKLEAALKDYLDVEHLSLFNNGTIALMAAIRALDLKNEVITTPFSFVATAHAASWNGLTPVFADIDPVTFNLDPEAVKAAITPKTTGILPVHCYGSPCDVDGIARIARDHKLKVIYDAAHAFGIRNRGSSILRHGDMSILSFHATKVFNTVEGGAVICHSAEMKKRVDLLRNFGFMGETRVEEVGINGKMSELHAAFGLMQLPHVDKAIQQRKEVDALYRSALGSVRGLELPPPPRQSNQNYSYFPVLVTPDYPLTRDGLYDLLKVNGILSRRYFYPLISDFRPYRDGPGVRHPMPRARRAADQVLCLPIYSHLEAQMQERIIELVSKAE